MVIVKILFSFLLVSIAFAVPSFALQKDSKKSAEIINLFVNNYSPSPQKNQLITENKITIISTNDIEIPLIVLVYANLTENEKAFLQITKDGLKSERLSIVPGLQAFPLDSEGATLIMVEAFDSSGNIIDKKIYKN